MEKNSIAKRRSTEYSQYPNNYETVWYFPEILHYSLYLKCIVCFVGKGNIKTESWVGPVSKGPSFQAVEFKIHKATKSSLLWGGVLNWRDNLQGANGHGVVTKLMWELREKITYNNSSWTIEKVFQVVSVDI